MLDVFILLETITLVIFRKQLKITWNEQVQIWVLRPNLHNDNSTTFTKRWPVYIGVLNVTFSCQSYALVGFMVFNATFNNISVISWWAVLLVEEARVPCENCRPAVSHWQTLSHNVVHLTPCITRHLWINILNIWWYKKCIQCMYIITWMISLSVITVLEVHQHTEKNRWDNCSTKNCHW
jgi:hypothetical protein